MAQVFGRARKPDRDAERKPWRFRLNYKQEPNEGSNIIILDETEEAFSFFEHLVRLDGQWQEITCPKKNKVRATCPLCRKGYWAGWLSVYTIIDTTGYKNREGKRKKNLKRVLPVKSQQAGKFELWRSRTETGNLFGHEIYAVRLGGEKSPSIGDELEPTEKKKYSKKELKNKFSVQLSEDESFLAPFDYAELYKVLPEDELDQIAEALPRAPKGKFDSNKDGEGKSSFKKGGKVKKSKSSDDDDESNEDEDEADEDEKPKKIFKGKKGRDDSDDDEEESEDDEEEKPKKKLKKAKASDEDDESESEEESDDDEDSDDAEESEDDDSEEEESEDSEDEEAEEESEDEDADEEEKPKKKLKKAKASDEDDESEDEEKPKKKGSKKGKTAKIGF